jgi:hypothetical protein
MSSMIPVAALLVLFASATPRHVPAPALSLPEAVLAHPVAEENPLLRALPWRSSSQAFATWGGPWTMQPGLYDHRYVTW